LIHSLSAPSLLPSFSFQRNSGFAARHGDGADQVADVGQEAVGFGQGAAVDRQVLAGQGASPSALVSCQVSQKLRGSWSGLNRKSARATRASPPKTWAPSCTGQRFSVAGGKGDGGNGETRPGEHRGGEEQDVEFLAMGFEAAGFGARLDHVGEFVVGARVGLEQAVEGGVDVVLGAVLQQAVDAFGQLGFPVAVFQFAAGFGEAGPGAGVRRRRAKGGRARRSGFVSWGSPEKAKTGF
jgi:hypothetical protein